VEPNPYESPKADEPLKSAQVVKRGLGVVAILLLTPVAVAVAFGGSCAATNGFLSSRFFNRLFGQELGLVILVGLSIFLIPPIVVLIGMLRWAIATKRRNAVHQSAEKRGDVPKT